MITRKNLSHGMQRMILAVIALVLLPLTVFGENESDQEKYYYFIIDDGKPYYVISFSYDQESRDLVEFSISIYQDGEIRNISIGSNG